jgi:hypothetical protein
VQLQAFLRVAAGDLIRNELAFPLAHLPCRWGPPFPSLLVQIWFTLDRPRAAISSFLTCLGFWVYIL